VVEALSPTSGDRDHHLEERVFEGFGVPEYWVVDPTLGLLTAWRLEDGRYQLRARYDRSSVLTCPDFPAIDVRLLDVFR
jgi:Uma2 family endonuclease